MQHRHLSSGCLTSKPPLILLAVGAALFAARLAAKGELAHASPAPVSQMVEPAAGELGPRPPAPSPR